MRGSVDAREIVYDMLLESHKMQTPSHVLLNGVLNKYQYLDKKDRALISRLFRGVLEYQPYLDQVIAQFSKVKLGKIKAPVKILLRLGSYQILKMAHIPDAAACNETVRLAKKRGLSGLSGYINGVLRGISRGKEALQSPDPVKEPVAYLSYTCALPQWLAKMWLSRYDFDTVKAMGEYMLSDTELAVRVRRPDQKDQIIRSLTEAGITVREGVISDMALRISGYDYLYGIPAFTEGALVVQDESAQLSALAAAPKAGDLIIDVCAAPGGKSIHLSDLMGNDGQVIARDLTEMKVQRIQENLMRCSDSCVTAEAADATLLRQQDIARADVVMADVPCSGLGVIGKKPDIKYHMTEDKILSLQSIQRDILKTVQNYVKPGGTLVYSTCTLTREENQDNVKWFLEHFPFEIKDLRAVLPERAAKQVAPDGTLSILPGMFDSDGFFIAAFCRTTDA